MAGLFEYTAMWCLSNPDREKLERKGGLTTSCQSFQWIRGTVQKSAAEIRHRTEGTARERASHTSRGFKNNGTAPSSLQIKLQTPYSSSSQTHHAVPCKDASVSSSPDLESPFWLYPTNSFKIQIFRIPQHLLETHFSAFTLYKYFV